MKIVINNCFGGFGLSDEATQMFLDLEINDVNSKWYNHKIVKIKDEWDTTHWFLLNDISFSKCDITNISDLKNNALLFCDFYICRTNTNLIKVVETLGNKANGTYSQLIIEDIPSGTLYRIDEYDGNESIEYKENDSWSIAT